MSCTSCTNLMGTCPTCGETKKSESFVNRIERRRHQGSHITSLQENSDQGPSKQGFYNIVGNSRLGAKYSRAWNSKVDGPGKGTW